MVVSAAAAAAAPATTAMITRVLPSSAAVLLLLLIAAALVGVVFVVEVPPRDRPVVLLDIVLLSVKVKEKSFEINKLKAKLTLNVYKL